MSTSAASPLAPPRHAHELSVAEVRRVIFASSLGTVFEWYDFYLYGSLAAIISKQFFSGVNPTAGFIFALLAFAAGFAVRPFGALVFGRLGDLVGRKYTFLVTILIMGMSTFIVGILPSYARIGIAAPVILILLRLLQGLALGGEYGGAATYVAEHAPHGKRGAYTSWIQTTATLGLFLSLLVILGCRIVLGTPAFEAWGWRIPFLVSLVLLAISVWIRLKLNESPLFQAMKAEGKTLEGAAARVVRRVGQPEDRAARAVRTDGGAGGGVVHRTVLHALLPHADPQGRRADGEPADRDVAAARHAVLSRLRLAVRPDRPQADHHDGAAARGAHVLPDLSRASRTTRIRRSADAQERAPVAVIADPDYCSVQFNPVGTSKFTSPCDVAKAALVRRGVPYSNEHVNVTAGPRTPSPGEASIRVGSTVIPSYDATLPGAADAGKAFDSALGGALTTAGYPASAAPERINKPMLTFLLWILVIYVTMVYGPIAAMLVELFPTRIRYTSMSLPYHIGNGWFGGFLPTDRLRDRRRDGEHLLGALVPDRRRGDHAGDRCAVRPRDEGRGHHE